MQSALEVGFAAKMKNNFAKILHFLGNFFLHSFARKTCENFSKNWELKMQNICEMRNLRFSQNAKFSRTFRFRIFASFIFAKKCGNSRKNLRNMNESFRIFSRNVKFAANPNWKPCIT